MTDQQATIQEMIKPVMDSLWAELGLAGLPDEEKDQLSQRILDHLGRAVSVKLLTLLPELEADEAKIQQLTPKEIDAMLAEHSVDFFALLMEEAAELREDLKNAKAFADGYIKSLEDSQDQAK